MSEYKFKQLADIDKVEEPADGTTVMGFENGKPIQMPMGSVKGAGGVYLLDPAAEDFSNTDPAYGDKVKEALLAGKQVWVRATSLATTASSTSTWRYSQVYQFLITKQTDGSYSITLYVAGVSTTFSPTLSSLSLAITA